jgi:hypothetical protein
MRGGKAIHFRAVLLLTRGHSQQAANLIDREPEISAFADEEQLGCVGCGFGQLTNAHWPFDRDALTPKLPQGAAYSGILAQGRK